VGAGTAGGGPSHTGRQAVQSCLKDSLSLHSDKQMLGSMVHIKGDHLQGRELQI
jgi:hypothetical protein